MRGPAVALLLALLLVASLLSGCIMLGPAEPTAEPVEAAAATVPIPAPVANPTGALGLHVPAGALRLDIRWDLGAATSDDEADAGTKAAAHEDGPAGILGLFPGLFVLLGPDGDRLFAGTPSVRLDGDGGGEASSNLTRGPPLSKGTVYQTDAPQAGLYRLITFGTMTLPRVTLDGDMVAPPLIPLPVTVTRTTLSSAGPTSSILDDSGTWDLPIGTVAVWGDLRGAGADASLDITTPDGAPVAELRRPVMADPAAAGLGAPTFGFDRIGTDAFADPGALDTQTVHWSVRGVGTGRAFGYAAVVGDMPMPPLIARHADDPGSGVPLEGSLSPQNAGGLVLPEGGRLVVRLGKSEYETRDHASFRIYDATGQRLLTGAVLDVTDAFALPAGPLAIINDGPGTIEVVVTGTAPADAVLHGLETRYATSSTRLGSPLGGADAETLRAVYGAPLVRFYLSTTGTLEDVHVQVVRADGTAVAALPDLYPFPDGTSPCCMMPAGVSWVQATGWVDPGVHRLDVRAEAGQGEIAIEAAHIDLDGLLGLVQDGN